MIRKDTTFVVSYISNIQKTHEFYKTLVADILELKEEKVVVNIGGHEIHFVLETTEPFTEYQYLTSPENRGQGVLFYVQVEDVKKFYNEITSKGLTPKTQVKDNHWDCKEFLIEDPDGYKLVFWS